MEIFNVKFAIQSVPKMMTAVPTTLLLTFIAMVLGLLLGLFIALTRIYKVPFLEKLSIGFVSVIRGIPLMVQLYIAFYAIPMGVHTFAQNFNININTGKINPMIYAATALTLNYSAYLSEVIRSSLGAVEIGQMEAAHSIGFTTTQAMIRVIIPQAVVIAIPNLGNTFINMVKDTSLAYMVMLMEIMGTAKSLASSGLNYLETYTVAALIYWALNIILEQVILILEKRLNRFNVGNVATAK